MVDEMLATLAFRNRALGAVFATTGLTTLTATAAGYTRADGGSFLTDGFFAGMEVAPTNFTQTDVGVIYKVEATLLTIDGGRSAQSSGANRAIVAGVPATRVWENMNLPSRPATRPYVGEAFLPTPGRMRTMPNDGGLMQEEGLYVFQYFGLANRGHAGIRKALAAIKARFTPGTSLTAGSETIRMREELAAYTSQILPREDGWALGTLTVPWRCHTRNAVAA